MAGVNKAMIIGNLGADPEMRYTANGTAVANLSIATNEQWTDKQSGEKQSRTEWHRVTLFGRNAEVASEYLGKGSSVFIEGRIQTDKWEDREGNARYTTKIIGNAMNMLDTRGGGGPAQNAGDSNGATAPAAAASAPAAAAASASAPTAADAGGDETFDDLPF